MWKFKLPEGKKQWLFLLSVGVILCILAFPAGKEAPEAQPVRLESLGALSETAQAREEEKMAGETRQQADSYEERLEQRVTDILKEVEGVGEVEVMIVLKSSAEKVIQVDGKKENSVTEETDTGGGIRKIQSQKLEEDTVLVSGNTQTGGNGTVPIIKKELYPELSGIVVTASGGGNPVVKAEISSAMEALFGLPAHKIKVLKRTE